MKSTTELLRSLTQDDIALFKQHAAAREVLAGLADAVQDLAAAPHRPRESEVRSQRVANAVQAPPQTVVELVDEITLGGTRVQVRGQDLDLAMVKLDPTNPRVANTVLVSAFGEGEALQSSLAKLLWDDPDVHALYQSVLQNKGLIERIIVRYDGTVAEEVPNGCLHKARGEPPPRPHLASNTGPSASSRYHRRWRCCSASFMSAGN